MAANPIKLFVLAAPLLLALSGCQIHPSLPTLTAQQQLVQQMQTWSADGKISVNMEGKRESASFSWKQNQKDYVVHLFGPFGQGTTWLRHTDKGVSLENAEIGVKHAPNPEQLMNTHLGWQVPVSNLQYWLRGLSAPRPAPKHQNVDERGLLTLLEQEDWTVQYNHYTAYDGLLLPTKMTAKHDSITVTIAIKQWQRDSDSNPELGQ